MHGDGSQCSNGAHQRPAFCSDGHILRLIFPAHCGLVPAGGLILRSCVASSVLSNSLPTVLYVMQAMVL